MLTKEELDLENQKSEKMQNEENLQQLSNAEKLELMKAGVEFSIRGSVNPYKSYKLEKNSFFDGYFITHYNQFKCSVKSINEDKIECFTFLFTQKVEEVIEMSDIEFDV